MSSAFYVYVYRDPRAHRLGVPIYVGKGCGARAWQHWKYGAANPLLARKLDKIRGLGATPIVEIIAVDSEAQAALAAQRAEHLAGLWNSPERRAAQSARMTAQHAAKRAAKLKGQTHD